VADLPEVLQSVILGPEDRLMLLWPSSLDEKARQQIAEQAAGDSRVLHAFGVEDVIVLRATKAEGSTVGQCGAPVPLVLSSGALTCHLAYGHTGKHSDGEATWTNPAGVRLLCGNRREYPSGEVSVCSLRPGHEGNHAGDDDTWSSEGSNS